MICSRASRSALDSAINGESRASLSEAARATRFVGAILKQLIPLFLVRSRRNIRVSERGRSQCLGTEVASRSHVRSEAINSD